MACVLIRGTQEIGVQTCREERLSEDTEKVMYNTRTEALRRNQPQ